MGRGSVTQTLVTPFPYTTEARDHDRGETRFDVDSIKHEQDVLVAQIFVSHKVETLIRRQPEYHEIDTLQQPNHLDNRVRSRRGVKWRLQRGAGYLPATNGYFSRPPPCSASLHQAPLVEQLANVLTGRTKSFSSTQLSLKFVQTLVLEHQQNDRVAVTLLRAFNYPSNTCRACVL